MPRTEGRIDQPAQRMARNHEHDPPATRRIKPSDPRGRCSAARIAATHTRDRRRGRFREGRRRHAGSPIGAARTGSAARTVSLRASAMPGSSTSR